MPELVEIGPELVEVGLNLVDAGLHWPILCRFGQIRSKSSQSWSIPSRVWAKLVEVGPRSVEVGQRVVDSGPSSPMSAEVVSNLSTIGPKLAEHSKDSDGPIPKR